MHLSATTPCLMHPKPSCQLQRLLPCPLPTLWGMIRSQAWLHQAVPGRKGRHLLFMQSLGMTKQSPPQMHHSGLTDVLQVITCSGACHHQHRGRSASAAGQVSICSGAGQHLQRGRPAPPSVQVSTHSGAGATHLPPGPSHCDLLARGYHQLCWLVGSSDWRHHLCAGLVVQVGAQGHRVYEELCGVDLHAAVTAKHTAAGAVRSTRSARSRDSQAHSRWGRQEHTICTQP